MMLSEGAKSRLSVAFASTKDTIRTCRNIVTESSIPPAKRNRILEDLTDVNNIMKQQKFEDVDAIEEAIVAVSEVYAYARNLPGEGRFKDSLGFILQWLEYIKQTLGYEGFVPGSTKDISTGSHTIQRTSQSDYYGYLDDSGTFIPIGYMEGHNYQEGY
ncbi:hypothetical protein Clacol_008019 [Clathrus columnatus]|uniref:Uncharacterized protein n=1 Tax=Clathrus columnatus TaxID=1419009 RepID=A0AAV5AKZ9_9AGAM|nr:hypothetical protein Clacol_008019 [Clathrus columnatus]